VSISTLAARNGLNGQTEENLGTDLSLDEACLSNGEVYTVLTNKAAHGCKGALVAMVCGVGSNTVIRAFKRMSRHKRLRVRYRWEVLDAENKAIREYREKRKEAKKRGDSLAPWEPTKMSNGETMPQIMARSKHIILKHNSKWKEQQRVRAQILFEAYPRLQQGYELSLKLTEIFNKRISTDSARLLLAKWYNDVEKFEETQFNRVLETFENHNQTIINYFEDRLTNASAESFNAKIKAFRGQFRGVGDVSPTLTPSSRIFL